MMQQLHKSFANRLAQAMTAPGGEDLIYLLQQAGMIERGGTDRPAQVYGANTVGIWERSGESQTWVRSAESRSEWGAWANVHRIGPKQAKRRVVFLGESVARGWGFPAQFTPAGVLGALLEQCCGPGEIEVVDLARNDMSLEIGELAVAAAALEPDLVMIFAGNNWQPQLPQANEDLRSFEEALSRAGVVGLKQLCEQQLAEAGKRVVADVCTFYAARNVPVVWVVPEWNLVDWFDGKISAPVIDATANREWIECVRQAESALSRGDDAQAAVLAQRMIDLDRGTTSYGLRILADCKRREGKLHDARRLLELARDARIWNSSHLTAPRAYSASQNAIRQAAAAFQCRIVDLPKVFASRVADLPDRRLFLDYCHLTAEGIRIAMAEATSHVSELLTGRRVDSAAALQAAPLPDEKVSADAEFLSAVHNAHWWQGREIVRYRCARAVALSPHIQEVMRGFLDLQTSPAPVQLSSAAEHLASLREQPTQGFILRNAVQLLDASLLEAIADAVNDGETRIRPQLVRQWQERNDIARQPANLLSFYYLSASTLPLEMDWAWTVSQEMDPKRFTGIDYYRAYWMQSDLAFCASSAGDVIVTATLRLPSHDSPMEVGLAVNGRHIARVAVARSWKTVRVKVPASALRDGINRLLVSWPSPGEPAPGTAREATRRLARGENDALLPVFGEIHLLTVAADVGEARRELRLDRSARGNARAESECAVT